MGMVLLFGLVHCCLLFVSNTTEVDETPCARRIRLPGGGVDQEFRSNRLQK